MRQEPVTSNPRSEPNSAPLFAALPAVFPLGNGEEGRRAGAIACILGLSFLAGCAEEIGPTKKDLVNVDGHIRIAGAPIRGGWVEFIPMDGAVGDIRSARLNPDGSFHATKVARGRNVVRVVYPPAQPPVDRVFTQFYTPVRPVIEAGKPLDIDLQREAVRARAAARVS